MYHGKGVIEFRRAFLRLLSLGCALLQVSGVVLEKVESSDWCLSCNLFG